MKILLAVASRHGGTRGIGEWIRDTFCAAGHDVALFEPDEIDSLDGYDAVVIGSAVYLAHWIPAARDLIDREGPALRQRPVWLFSSGLATQPASAANSPNELADLRERAGARGHRSFRGRLDRSVLTFAERAAIAGARSREGDHRDEAAVRAWALEVLADLADLAERPYAPRAALPTPGPGQHIAV